MQFTSLLSISWKLATLLQLFTATPRDVGGGSVQIQFNMELQIGDVNLFYWDLKRTFE